MYVKKYVNDKYKKTLSQIGQEYAKSIPCCGKWSFYEKLSGVVH